MRNFFKINLFTPTFEILNLLIPVFFLIFILLDFFGNIHLLNDLSRIEVSILSNIILLNITHNAFTYVLLTSTSPLKIWLDHQSGGERSFWFKQLWILVGLTLFFTTLLYLSAEHKILLLVFNLINFNFAAHHGLAQSFGLSLIYNRELPPSAEKIKIEKSERFLFSLFLYTNLIAGSVYFIFYFKLLKFSQTDFMYFINSASLIILVVSLFMLGHSVYAYKKDFWPKWLFNIRYLIWPLTLFSPLAIFATAVIHGLEYGFVSHKMIKNDSFRKPTIGFAIIGVFIFFALFRIFNYEKIRLYEQLPLWLVIATAISISGSFMHYFLDRRLFKMRHQLNRDTVGTLLFNKKSN